MRGVSDGIYRQVIRMRARSVSGEVAPSLTGLSEVVGLSDGSLQEDRNAVTVSFDETLRPAVENGNSVLVPAGVSITFSDL